MVKYTEKPETRSGSGKTLFKETSASYNSSDIQLGGNFQIYDYINGFKLSADTLADAGINAQPTNLNHYIYSIIYNYKQFIELSMKAIYLFYSNDSVEIKTQNIASVSHNLEMIWELIEPLLNLIYTTPEDVIVMQAAKEYVIEFHKLNNDSYNFKYPFTKDLIASSTSEVTLDVVNMKEKIEELDRFFRRSDLMLEEYVLHINKQ